MKSQDVLQKSCLVLLVVTVVSARGAAQTAIEGVVREPTGKLIPGAAITRVSSANDCGSDVGAKFSRSRLLGGYEHVGSGSTPE